MTQFINPKPVAAMSSMGARPDPYTQGMGGVLSLADGGLARKPYLFGGIKRRLKKLIPKEAAGIMQMAAPFVAPHSMLGAAALSGLGQYKSKGKINPLQLAMSVAPGIKNAQISKLTGGRWNPTDIKGQDNFLRTLMGKVPGYDAVDTKMFGEVIGDGMQASDITEGWMGSGGQYGGIGELLSKGTEAVLTNPITDSAGNITGRKADKMAIISLALGGMSYAEAKKQMQLAGKGDLEDDYGITEEVWEATDWSNAFKDNATLGNAEGGLPRVRQAMGTSQFPLMSTRSGLKWGSDKGEGLGGEQVEADMRFTGGFMPYGEEPKADDVPARLSKDEFVFTDEAVAGMGEGDVNVGAERLYNMMKQLEQQGAPGQSGIGAIV